MKFGAIKKDFPALSRTRNGHPLIYVDNAATTHKPQVMIDAFSRFYGHEYGSVYRSIYDLGERATEQYEAAREKVARFIGADACELIITRGATESINAVATMWAREIFKQGDEIVLSELEHHANLIPWQEVARKTGAILRFIPVNAHGTLSYDQLEELITAKTRLVSVTWTSNAIGTHVDLDPLIGRARQVGAYVLIDATQTVPHRSLDVHALDVDFLVFSAHKMMGPTGLGFLYINQRLHAELMPYQYGGGMVYDAHWYGATYRKAPFKFEAGTPPIAELIAFGASIDYIEKNIDFDLLKQHEADLCSRLITGLEYYPQIRILGPIEELKKSGHVVSFLVDGVHAHDVAAFLDRCGICVRAGNHCAQPLHEKLGVFASVRLSFYAYNTQEEVDVILKKIDSLLISLC